MTALGTNGVLTIGADAAPPAPMQIGQAGTAEFSGFEVDLLNETAARLQLSVRYKSALWAEITEALLKNEVDVVCSAATITPERAQEFDFSRPYLRLSLAVVTATRVILDPGRELSEQLSGKRLGVRIETTAEKFIFERLRPSSVQRVHFNDEAYRALQTGEVDAVVDDSPIAKYFVRVVPGLREPALVSGTEACYGIMFRKDEGQLREQIDRVLENLERDGTYSRLYTKWFGASV